MLDRMACTVGIISDTHGLLRPEALESLKGCDRIIHGGDIGGAQILERLSEIAPVVAVRGNNDRDDWADRLPACERLEVAGICFHVLHELALLDIDPQAAGVDVVVSGHSHRPSIAWREGVCYLNPGSAGRRRFHLPVAIARVEVNGDAFEPRIVELVIG
jgi:uncharacterized protein